MFRRFHYISARCNNRSHRQYENASISPLPWQLESCWWFSQLAKKQEMLEKEYKEETTEKGNPQFRTAFFGVTNLHWCIKVPKESDEQKLGMMYGSLLNEVLKSFRIRKTWGKHVTFNITAMFSSSSRPVQFRPWATSREKGRIFHLPALLISLAKIHDIVILNSQTQEFRWHHHVNFCVLERKLGCSFCWNVILCTLLKTEKLSKICLHKKPNRKGPIETSPNIPQALGFRMFSRCSSVFSGQWTLYVHTVKWDGEVRICFPLRCSP